MKKSSIQRAILTAMFAAMVCVSTLCIQIASPAGGYVNLGDALVLMSGFLLGPVYGAAAAGIGSGLADILTGYAYYAPGTIIIKAIVALTAAILAGRQKKSESRRMRLTIAALPGEIFMILGYLYYAWFILGHGPAALASVTGNAVQAVAGIIIACLLTPIVQKPREIQEMLKSFHKTK